MRYAGHPLSIFDDLFDSAFLFDSEYRQRRDIQRLQQQVSHSAASNHGPALRAAAARIDQLELLCSALAQLLVTKGLTTQAELRVIMQQLDLVDGVEDGRASTTVADKAPRCSHCQRFINPAREACVYCGTPMAQAMPPRPATTAAPPVAKPRPSVACKGCGRVVLESDTYFTGRGLVCGTCFQRSPG